MGLRTSIRDNSVQKGWDSRQKIAIRRHKIQPSPSQKCSQTYPLPPVFNVGWEWICNCTPLSNNIDIKGERVVTHRLCRNSNRRQNSSSVSKDFAQDRCFEDRTIHHVCTSQNHASAMKRILDGEWRISSRHIITSHSCTLVLLEKALHLPPVHRIPDKRQALH